LVDVVGEPLDERGNLFSEGSPSQEATRRRVAAALQQGGKPKMRLAEPE